MFGDPMQCCLAALMRRAEVVRNMVDIQDSMNY